MKQLKDYLHLYLGCECEIQFKDGAKGVTKMEPAHLEATRNTGIVPTLKSLKPLLKPLSTISEDEWLEVARLHTQQGGKISISLKDIEDVRSRFMCADVFVYLLSRHFDLFGLIESGLAIDKTTLNQKP